MKKVEIYSTPTCFYCNEAKQYFTEHHVAYTEYNVATDLSKRREMVEKSGQMGVPVIAIDGAIVVGFDEKQLKQMLAL